jgi:pilus assembly protein CpaB
VPFRSFERQSPPRPPLARAVRRLGTARRLRRHPLAYWLVAAAVAVGAGTTVARAVGAAEAERARLGGVRPALVAAADLPAGRRLADGDVRVVAVPRSVLPDRPAAPGDAAGRVLGNPVAAGQVLSRSDLARAGTSPLAARLPAGRRGVAVPGGPGGLRLSSGDVVDIYATFPPDAAGGGEPTFAVARAAGVLDVTDDAVTVAVREAEVAAVAFALAGGVVTLALTAG